MGKKITRDQSGQSDKSNALAQCWREFWEKENKRQLDFMENNQKYVLKAARKMERDMKRYGGLGMAVFLRHRNLEDYIRDEIADASENQGWISAARRAAEKIRCENPGLQIKVDDMADQVAEILKGQGIRGRGGRVLTAATIKRESLRSTNCKKNSIKPLVGVKPP